MKRLDLYKIWRGGGGTDPPPPIDTAVVGRLLDEKHLWPVLDAIEGPGFLTAEQVGRLCYPDMQRSTKGASQRLKSLMEQGVVDAFQFSRRGQRGRGGAAPLIYCLTRNGARLLSAHRGCSVTDIKWSDEQKVLNTVNIFHRLDEANFHLALAQACRESGYIMGRFTYEPRFSLDKGRVLGPDGMVEIERPGVQLTALMLEIDRDTERPKRFAERARLYETFYTSGQYELWLREPPTVLVVVTVGGERRVHELREAVGRAARDGGLTFKRYRFAAVEWLYTIQPGFNGYAGQMTLGFSHPTCLKIGTDERVSILGGGA